MVGGEGIMRIQSAQHSGASQGYIDIKPGGMIQLVPAATNTVEATTNVDYLHGTRMKTGDGTAALPAYAFHSDTDMGLYRVSDNVMGIAVSGAQVARFTSSGYLVLSQASNRLVMATDEASYMEYSDAVDEWIFVTDGTAEMTLSTTALIVPNVYSNTTATAANVNVHTNGSIRRSTSSRAIKANERPLADDGFLDLIQAVAYWSIPDERPLWGFIAEDMAEINPRFTDGETDHISDRAIIAKLVARVQALTREVRG